MQFRLKKITSDASFREFYRLRKGKKVIKPKKKIKYGGKFFLYVFWKSATKRNC